MPYNDPMDEENANDDVTLLKLILLQDQRNDSLNPQGLNGDQTSKKAKSRNSRRFTKRGSKAFTGYAAALINLKEKVGKIFI